MDAKPASSAANALARVVGSFCSGRFQLLAIFNPSQTNIRPTIGIVAAPVVSTPTRVVKKKRSTSPVICGGTRGSGLGGWRTKPLRTRMKLRRCGTTSAPRPSDTANPISQRNSGSMMPTLYRTRMLASGLAYSVADRNSSRSPLRLSRLQGCPRSASAMRSPAWQPLATAIR